MSKKILLADDSVTIQKIVEITFQEEDFEVWTVSNGLDALEKVKGDRPDIILADISMPGLNGIDLCEKLKNDPKYKNTPFILLTNSFEEFDKKKCDKIGVDGYIEKPFESQDLLDMVQLLVEEKVSEEKKEDSGLISIDDERETQFIKDEEKDKNLKVSDLEEELGLELIDDDEEKKKEKEKIMTTTTIESEDKEKPSEELKDITEITEEEISLEELKKEKKIPQEDILSLKAEREEEVIEKEEEKQDILKPPSETKEYEKFEPKEEIKDVEEERVDLKELDQALGKYLRNLAETTFKNSIDQMTPKINEIVEKVTKEIVPGIAESIIKKEIERLKSGSEQ